MLLSLDSGPKKIRNVESKHQLTSGQRAALKGHSGQQCVSLTCFTVENALDKKLKSQRPKAKGTENKFALVAKLYWGKKKN